MPQTLLNTELILWLRVLRTLLKGNFVFAAVKGDYGKDIIPLYDYVVVLEVPKNVRSQRIRNRSFQKFGNRMLIGGDLYSQEEAFFQIAESRQDDYVENWLQTVKCPIIRVDGTKPIKENVEYMINSISMPADMAYWAIKKAFC